LIITRNPRVCQGLLCFLLMSCEVEPYPYSYQTQLPLLTREGLSWILYLGGSTDAQGYFRYAIPSDQAFGVILSDGLHAYQIPGNIGYEAITFQAQGGYLIRYQFSFEGEG
jgi:hypothetical protein